MMAAILNSAICGFRHLVIFFSDSLKNILTPIWLWLKHNSIWLKLIHSHLTWWWQASWILPIFAFSHLSFSSQTHWHLPRLVPSICTKTTSLIHSDSTWWCQPSWHSAILDSDTLFFFLRFTQKHSLSTLTLTQTNSIWLKLIYSYFNLMMAAILNSAIFNLAILDSAILVFPLKLTHTCQDWFSPFAQNKLHLIHSDSTWWCQPSWHFAMLDSDTLFSFLRFTPKALCLHFDSDSN